MSPELPSCPRAVAEKAREVIAKVRPGVTEGCRSLPIRRPPEHMMHYLASATAGAVRGIMSAANLRGPLASLMHANLRLTFDQTLENAMGVGVPPWRWRPDELVIDVSHEALYAVVTGALSDRLVPPMPTSSARRMGLGARLRGRE